MEDEIYLASIASFVQGVPQLQTTVTTGEYPVSTIINNPWVEVTSVNGMTGDVVVELALEGFQANHFYKKNTAILYNNNLYFAKIDFTSGADFDVDDWGTPTFVQEQADWAESDNTKNSYIKNKPTLATVATTGSFTDLTNQPTIDASIDRASTNAIQNQAVYAALLPKADSADLGAVAFSNDYTDLDNLPEVDDTLSSSSENAVQNKVIKTAIDGKQDVLQAGDITTALLADHSVTPVKMQAPYMQWTSELSTGSSATSSFRITFTTNKPWDNVSLVIYTRFAPLQFFSINFDGNGKINNVRRTDATTMNGWYAMTTDSTANTITFSAPRTYDLMRVGELMRYNNSTTFITNFAVV